MNVEYPLANALASKPLPTGYSQSALILRRFLLNFRLLLASQPRQRELLLERTIRTQILPRLKNGKFDVATAHRLSNIR